MKKGGRTILIFLLCCFALIGMIFSSIFAAEQLDLLSIRGSIEERNSFFLDDVSTPIHLAEDKGSVLCRLHVLATYSPITASNFLDVYSKSSDAALLNKMLIVAARRHEGTTILKEYEDCNYTFMQTSDIATLTSFAWTETSEWATLKAAFPKDVEVINKVSLETGVEARLIVAAAVPEQMRFFTSTRDSYKRYFEPLKILGTLSQFSLGVTGIKPETAKLIEEYAADSSSDFYPGPGYDTLLAYDGDIDHDTALYNRLTDSHNHYYQYLYTAVYIQEIISQWERAGYDITQSPGALVTLFNIGFANSEPKPAPELGGASITVGNETYTFGRLGEEFYYSGELADIFPYQEDI